MSEVELLKAVEPTLDELFNVTAMVKRESRIVFLALVVTLALDKASQIDTESGTG